MIKEFYKLSDINEVIWAYDAKLRSLDTASEDYNITKDYLDGLKVKKKALTRKNAGNSAFFHNGIPPYEPKKSRKQLKLDAIDKAIREEKTRHENTLSELYRERDKVKHS